MADPTTHAPERRRSVAFLESRGDTWACFLVTRPDPSGAWRGWFAFRPRHGTGERAAEGPDEVRTTEIFIEATEEEIHDRARRLGRPLLAGLLESALHTSGWSHTGADRLGGRFRSLLAESSKGLAGDWPGADVEDADLDPARLGSLYASYRLDQVAHFISLVTSAAGPAALEEAVDRILEGERVDFLPRDRMQYAMMVVDRIERLLPLPDFETWLRDFTEHREAYRVYAHALHREGRLG
ncbi:MAG TPA: hypothetical protein VFQ22_00975 [Longimicrobiales bacterium]|nr:hypothetical protein [Longimicrobiales bacterium]